MGTSFDHPGLNALFHEPPRLLQGRLGQLGLYVERTIVVIRIVGRLEGETATGVERAARAIVGRHGRFFAFYDTEEMTSYDVSARIVMFGFHTSLVRQTKKVLILLSRIKEVADTGRTAGAFIPGLTVVEKRSSFEDGVRTTLLSERRLGL